MKVPWLTGFCIKAACLLAGLPVPLYWKFCGTPSPTCGFVNKFGQGNADLVRPGLFYLAFSLWHIWNQESNSLIHHLCRRHIQGQQPHPQRLPWADSLWSEIDCLRKHRRIPAESRARDLRMYISILYTQLGSSILYFTSVIKFDSVHSYRLSKGSCSWERAQFATLETCSNRCCYVTVNVVYANCWTRLEKLLLNSKKFD